MKNNANSGHCWNVKRVNILVKIHHAKRHSRLQSIEAAYARATHAILMQCKCNTSTAMQWRTLIMHCAGDDGRCERDNWTIRFVRYPISDADNFSRVNV